MSLRQKAAAPADADADGRAEAAALWPAVYTEPHAVAPFELVRPHAVPEPVFAACWACCDTTARFCYALVPRSGGGGSSSVLDAAAWNRAKTALLARAPQRLHVHEVARSEWAGGTHFHAAYSFASWFDDVFAMHVFGAHTAAGAGTARVCVELRCTHSCALRGFTAVTLQRALFADVDYADIDVVSCDSL